MKAVKEKKNTTKKQKTKKINKKKTSDACSFAGEHGSDRAQNAMWLPCRAEWGKAFDHITSSKVLIFTLAQSPMLDRTVVSSYLVCLINFLGAV